MGAKLSNVPQETWGPIDIEPTGHKQSNKKDHNKRHRIANKSKSDANNVFVQTFTEFLQEKKISRFNLKKVIQTINEKPSIDIKQNIVAQALEDVIKHIDELDNLRTKYLQYVQKSLAPVYTQYEHAQKDLRILREKLQNNQISKKQYSIQHQEISNLLNNNWIKYNDAFDEMVKKLEDADIIFEEEANKQVYIQEEIKQLEDLSQAYRKILEDNNEGPTINIQQKEENKPSTLTYESKTHGLLKILLPIEKFLLEKKYDLKNQLLEQGIQTSLEDFLQETSDIIAKEMKRLRNLTRIYIKDLRQLIKEENTRYGNFLLEYHSKNGKNDSETIRQADERLKKEEWQEHCKYTKEIEKNIKKAKEFYKSEIRIWRKERNVCLDKLKVLRHKENALSERKAAKRPSKIRPEIKVKIPRKSVHVRKKCDLGRKEIAYATDSTADQMESFIKFLKNHGYQRMNWKEVTQPVQKANSLLQKQQIIEGIIAAIDTDNKTLEHYMKMYEKNITILKQEFESNDSEQDQQYLKQLDEQLNKAQLRYNAIINLNNRREANAKKSLQALVTTPQHTAKSAHDTVSSDEGYVSTDERASSTLTGSGATSLTAKAFSSKKSK